MASSSEVAETERDRGNTDASADSRSQVAQGVTPVESHGPSEAPHPKGKGKGQQDHRRTWKGFSWRPGPKGRKGNDATWPGTHEPGQRRPRVLLPGQATPLRGGVGDPDLSIFGEAHEVLYGPLAHQGADLDLEHQTLCSLVKRMQRQSDELCSMWWSWCEATGNGRKDPKLHSLEFLRNFVVAAEGRAQRAHEASQMVERHWWHKELVRRVKQGQRSSDAFKSQWWRYCDTFGGNVRDPGRHQARFIENFLAHFMNGTITSLYASSTAGNARSAQWISL